MKNYSLQAFVLVVFMITMTGCSVVGDIFEAGVWIGVILVVLVVVIIFWLIKKLF